MKRKSAIVIAILIMSIGFAAISTTLIINGNVNIGENTDDFSVIFTEASLDGKDVYNDVIDDTKKTITFETSDLKTLNQTSVLNYEVTNNSANYDAEVSVNCKVKDNTTARYTSIKNELEGNARVVKAKTSLNGTLTVNLEKVATEEVREEYVCTLTFNAVERDELGISRTVIPVSSQDKNGIDLKAKSYEITGNEKTELLNKLEETNLVENIEEVTTLIEVKSNSFEDMAATTFNLANIANEGDKVVILHYDTAKEEWEFIAEKEVNANGLVEADFSSYSPVAFVVKKSDGTYEKVDLALYKFMKAKADTTTVIDYKIRSGASGTNGIYMTTQTEDNVPVYYFRGDADKVNNNIIFNNMCWKIIRTTETDGVKLIYNGVPTDGKCEIQTGEETQIGTSKFNEKYDDNAYVGYMYGAVGSSTYALTHANTNNSTIKTYIDNWYSRNFDETTTSKLEDTVFCNDRSTKAYDANTIGYTSMSSYGALGYGKNGTLYGAAHRASYYSNNPNPSLECKNNNDKFTVDSKNGNGKLTNPAGLITNDEVILAGFNTYYSNTSDYKDTTNCLYTNSNYWTFSPVMMYAGGFATVGRVDSAGVVGHSRESVASGVRPVVSLASGTFVTGEGTTTNPYVVK